MDSIKGKEQEIDSIKKQIEAKEDEIIGTAALKKESEAKKKQA